ncbi:MAG: hypothetical protein V4654_01140 [Bdellovibrionota bacterium]
MQSSKKFSPKECLKPKKTAVNVQSVFVNQKHELKPGNVAYLKLHEYSFAFGEDSATRDFSKTKEATFLIYTPAGGGFAIDAVKACRGRSEL